MQNILNNILIAFLGIISISCMAQVYSPSINLPDKIRKNETKIVAAYEGLPELDHFIDNGLIVAVQHSFSDKFNMQAKYWTDIDTYGSPRNYLHGASLTSYILLDDSNSVYKSFFVPTLGISMNKELIKMWTIGAWYAVQTPSLYFMEPYYAFGLMYGNSNTTTHQGFGFGIISNLGANIKLCKNLRLNIELTVPAIWEMNSNSFIVFFTPTIGFNYGI